MQHFGCGKCLAVSLAIMRISGNKSVDACYALQFALFCNLISWCTIASSLNTMKMFDI